MNPPSSNPSSSAAPAFLLKVMSGPHQGAEMTLKDGEYLLGSDHSCDIVLNDILLSPQHLRLIISGNQISIVALAQPTYVDGLRVPIGPRPLNLFQFLGIGSTQLIIGPPDRTQWPEAATLRPPPLEAGDNPEEGEYADSEIVENADLDGDFLTEGEPPRYARPADLSSAVAMPAKSRIPTLVIWAIAAAAGILVGWGVWYLFYGQSNVPTPQNAKVDPGQQALAALKNIPGVMKPEIVHKDGQTYAQAYTETDGQKHDAEIAVSKLNNGVVARIYSKEEILRSAREVFAVLGDLQVKADMPQAGILTVFGYVDDPATWERARATLLEDVGGVHEVNDNEVYTPAKAIALGTRMLTENQLQRDVTFNIVGKRLVATGVVAGHKLDVWRQLKADLMARLFQAMPIEDLVRLPDGTLVASLPPLPAKNLPGGQNGQGGPNGNGAPTASPSPSANATASPSAPGGNATPPPIVPTPPPHIPMERLSAINNGKLPYITLSNGRKYFLGALLPNYYVLTEVTMNTATLEHNKRRVQIANGEELPQPPPEYLSSFKTPPNR